MAPLDYAPFFGATFGHKSSKSSSSSFKTNKFAFKKHLRENNTVGSFCSDETCSNSTGTSNSSTSSKTPSILYRFRQMSLHSVLRSRSVSEPTQLSMSNSAANSTTSSLSLPEPSFLSASMPSPSLSAPSPMYRRERNGSSRSLNRVSMGLNEIVNHSGMDKPRQYNPPRPARPFSVMSFNDDSFTNIDGEVLPLDAMIDNKNMKIKDHDEIILRVGILAAKDLAYGPREELTNPYAVIRIDSKKYQTSVLHDTVNPDWNFTLDLRLTPKNCPRLINITLWDETAWGRDYLGEVSIPVINIFDRNAGDRFLGSPRSYTDDLNIPAWFELQRKRKTPRFITGDVLCKFGFVETAGQRSESEWLVRWRMITQRARYV